MTEATHEAPSWRDRLGSMGWDYLVIAGWLVVLTGAGAIVRPALPDRTPSLPASDALAAGITVLPVWGYLTVSEAVQAHASLGKRRRALMVVDAAGRPVGWGRSGLRNAIKLMPWQIAHLAVSRYILGRQIPVAVLADVGAVGAVAVTFAMAARDPSRRALHDRIAGTKVISTPKIGG